MMFLKTQVNLFLVIFLYIDKLINKMENKNINKKCSKPAGEKDFKNTTIQKPQFLYK